MKYTRTAAFAALGAAAALSLTACGGDDSQKDSSAKSSSASSSSTGGSSSGGSSSGGTNAGSAKSASGDAAEAPTDSGKGAGQVAFCKVGNLSMKAKDGGPDEKTGNVFVTMTNKGSTTCSVTGFPKVLLKDVDHTSTPISRDHNEPRVADLKPGESAGFNISYKTAHSGDTLTHPTDIEVTPPHGSHQVSLEWPSGSINGSYGDVLIHPFHADPVS